jgi:hypothetical protein
MQTFGKDILGKYGLTDNVVKDILHTSEEDVDTFASVIEGTMDGSDNPVIEKDVIRKLVSGQPDRVTGPKDLTESVSGFIRIFHGWHDNHYVWHIEHAAIRRPWKVSSDRVLYAIAKVSSAHIPERIEVQMWNPSVDWELKTYTMKAMNLRSDWSFREESISDLNKHLFEALNTLV